MFGWNSAGRISLVLCNLCRNAERQAGRLSDGFGALRKYKEAFRCSLTTMDQRTSRDNASSGPFIGILTAASWFFVFFVVNLSRLFRWPA